MAEAVASHTTAAEQSESTVTPPCEDRPPPVGGYSPSANGLDSSEYSYM